MPLLTIEKMIYGGDALARHDGKAVFVPFALSGEGVQAEIVESRKSFSRAVVSAIEEASAERVKAPCPHFGRCGGCQYQHASYEAQLRIKREIFVETLRRTGGIEIEAIDVIGSPLPFGYRNRTRMHVRHHPQFAIGYYRAGTHELMEIGECPISSSLINRTLATLRTNGLAKNVHEVEIFCDHEDARSLIELYVNGEADFDHIARSTAESLAECVGVHCFLQSKTARGGLSTVQHVGGVGAQSLAYRVGEHEYQVRAGAFFQVNRALVPQMAEIATRGPSGRRALDLYAGVGLFAAPLAERFEEVIAVEASPISFADLESNVPDAQRFCQTTESFLKHRANLANDCDVAIVDPPRAGLGEAAATMLASAAPRQITYVSCDPATLARDLKILLSSGYRIGEAHLVDMFPQTFHIESIIRLDSRRHES